VTFLVHSSSSFLNLFDEKTDLPRAIILSGFLGVSMAWLFSFIQNRSAFFRLSISVFILILLIVATLRLGFENEDFIREFTFISFVFIGPLNAITMLIFWGLVGRMFSIKQTKKIIGSIDSGQLIGTIITSFSIPLVLKFMFESVNLLLVGGASIIFSLVILVITRKLYSSEVFENETETGKRKAVSYSELFKNKYFLIIAAFIAISMVGAVFVDYSFLHVTAKNYPDPKDLAIFIARFEGTMLIFSFLVQTFVTDRLIALYGLKITILVTPVVLLLCCVLAMIMGLSLEYGVMFNSFIFFFLAISLCKLFNTALKDAIDGPTIKLYILPVDSSVRLDVQSKIDGVIKLFASLLGGFILIAIESSKLFPVTLISLFLFVVIGIWIFIANAMYKKYKETLQNTLANTPVKEEESYKTEYAIGKLLQNELEKRDHYKVLTALNLIEKIQPFLLDDSLKLISRTRDFQLKGLVDKNMRRE
jgi:ATP:ADP antiporter, AAA family